jgi:hypothetical protein
MSKTTQPMTVTDEQIMALRDEAFAAGDIKQYVFCCDALNDDEPNDAARAKCEAAIRAAQSMAE